MNTNFSYTDAELKKLHLELLDILKETIRVCDICNIEYFIIGGTALGAFFFNDIVPWDDDIDIGMRRSEYEKFIQIAPNYLGSDFFLQTYETEPDTTTYFAKVRRNGTLFLDEGTKELNIHHGIYIDIFPLDNVPVLYFVEKIQRRFVNLLDSCFIAKTVAKKTVEKGTIVDKAQIKQFILRNLPISKKTIYYLIRIVSSWYNGREAEFINFINTKVDHIEIESIENMQKVRLGGLIVKAPNNLERYLKRHYPKLRKYIPKEEQVNHRPIALKFSSKYKL